MNEQFTIEVVWLGWVMLGFGVVVLLIGLVERRKNRRNFGRAAIAEGEVVPESAEEDEDANASRVQPASFSFASSHGERHRARFRFKHEGRQIHGIDNVISNKPRYRPGKRVKIIYNPADPRHAAIYDGNFRAFVLIPFAISAMFALMGLLVLYAYYSGAIKHL